MALAVFLLGASARVQASPGRSERGSIVHSTATVAFWVWREVITPGDGPRCTLAPSCSAFAQQAVARDGPVGVWLAADRLVREPFAWDGAVFEGRHRADPLGAHPGGMDLLLGRRCRRQRRAGAEICL